MTTPLEASIKHWETMRDSYAVPRLHYADCALCTVHPKCDGCPVALSTGETNCYGTPYYAALDAWFDWAKSPHSPHRRKEWRKEAQNEIDFLRGLLNGKGNNHAN